MDEATAQAAAACAMPVTTVCIASLSSVPLVVKHMAYASRPQATANVTGVSGARTAPL